MKVIQTASAKLFPTPQEKIILLNTITAFTSAYNNCCSVGFENNIKNSIKLHKLTYNSSRENLPSQLAISARMMAANSLASLFTARKKNPEKTFSCPKSKRMSICLDRNSHSIKFDKQIVSILTCEGRLRLPFHISDFFSKFINWKHSSAQLVFRKNKFFLNVQFEKDFEDVPKSGKYIGIDRGIKKIAVTSDNRFFGGGTTRRICKRYQSIRSKLKVKGTKSAKRHLRRLSGKEKRFKADVNHCISKRIVEQLKPGTCIVLEDLSGIRNKRMRKKLRTDVNSWSFLQLEIFLTYKAGIKGVHIEYVDPRYTSLRCSCCGNILRSNRKTQANFECKKCGFKLNADLNAARNIVLKHRSASTFFEDVALDRAPVNEPNVSSKEKSKDFCGGSYKPRGSSPR